MITVIIFSLNAVNKLLKYFNVIDIHITYDVYNFDCTSNNERNKFIGWKNYNVDHKKQINVEKRYNNYNNGLSRAYLFLNSIFR